MPGRATPSAWSDMLRIACRSSSPGARPAIVKRRNRPGASCHGGSSRRVPCQAMSGAPRPGAGRPGEEAVRRQAGWRRRRAISSRTKRSMSRLVSVSASRTTRARCPGSRRCCCRLGCAAPRRPRGSSGRRARASGSPDGCGPAVAAALAPRDRSVSPSTPQFQLRLSSLPSRLSSPFASLCLRS